jgi:uncharacterized protein DUF4148
MNDVKRIFRVSALTLAVASGSAYADSRKTRGRVVAELFAAKKTGDLPFGEASTALREPFPWLYSVSEATGVTHSGAPVCVN